MTFEEFNSLYTSQSSYFTSLLPEHQDIRVKGGSDPHVYLKLDSHSYVIYEGNYGVRSNNIPPEQLPKLETVVEALFNGYQWMFAHPEWLESSNFKQYMFDNSFNPNTMFIK